MNIQPEKKKALKTFATLLLLWAQLCKLISGLEKEKEGKEE